MQSARFGAELFGLHHRHTPQGRVGPGGASLLSLLDAVIREQGSLPMEKRRGTLVVVDEIKSMLGVDYESMLSELDEFGGILLLVPDEVRLRYARRLLADFPEPVALALEREAVTATPGNAVWDRTASAERRSDRAPPPGRRRLAQHHRQEEPPDPPPCGAHRSRPRLHGVAGPTGAGPGLGGSPHRPAPSRLQVLNRCRRLVGGCGAWRPPWVFARAGKLGERERKSLTRVRHYNSIDGFQNIVR